MQEGDQAILTVVINFASTNDITVVLDTNDGTAEGIIQGWCHKVNTFVVSSFIIWK